MRKNLFFVVLFATMLTVGCGKSTNATDHYQIGSNHQNSSIIKDQSSEDQSSSSSSLNSFEDNSSEISSPEINVSNEGHEPDRYGTGNFQDYWEGDDFFDLESYAKANGCEKVVFKTYDDLKETDGTIFNVCYLFFKGWRLTLYDSTAISVHRPDKLCFNIKNLDLMEQEYIAIKISKKNDFTLDLRTIDNLNIIFPYLQQCTDDTSDPFIDSGLFYTVDTTEQHLE